MSTVSMDKRPVFAVADLFLSIFGPMLVAAIVLIIASSLNIL